MKLVLLVAFLGIITAILNPTTTLQGATTGLNTWLYGLVPTLLPFMIVSNFILSKEISQALFTCLPKGLQSHYRKVCIAFNIIAGFTFGLPIGAKITSTLLKNQCIDRQEGQILLNHCNAIGPSFVGGFFLTKCLHKSQWLPFTFALLYLPQLFGVLLCLRRHKSNIKEPITHQKIKISRLKNCFQILDISIVNGFETIAILGGYLILFGILCAYIARIPIIPYSVKAYLIAVMEITSGTRELSYLPISAAYKFTLILPLITFGGLCTLLQTKSITKGCPLSMRSYLLHKGIYSFLTAIIISIGLFILC
ncbi:MAG: hypothetical protein PUB19_02055 [Lachnospiraceae bacterium]|nr:hypothetical protein [Lachnospiraceae bacterium]